MESISGDDGGYTLTLSFEPGTDPDIDAVNADNRVQVALSKVLSELRQQGVTVKKQSSALPGVNQLARRNVGTPVFGGMIAASAAGIFVIPILYVVFQSRGVPVVARACERTRPGRKGPRLAGRCLAGRLPAAGKSPTIRSWKISKRAGQCASRRCGSRLSAPASAA
ncbi:hypothetical protein [Rhodopila sp.]|jgi:hypothetical protein|uniref:hypothetical protein n=1 Tax=Rhodopila sp. TaxID=2480087 RepID=UPI002BF3B087|nr:hypothetical protein [Rhodopila sp.]HVZ07688.1 hypothetical protein [Rhodopila sp.]